MILPVFPLGTPLLPYQLLPLHVFEERYRTLTRQCLAGDRRFGVVLIERGREVADAEGRRDDIPFDVGAVAQVVDAAELPDGRFVLQTVGRERFRVERWLPDDPYPRAEVEILVEEPGDDPATPLAEVATRLERVHALRSELGETIADHEFDADPVLASWEASLLAGLGALDLYRLLTARDATERLTLLASLLDDAEAVLLMQLGL
ncbi:MAG TPA: LON peptidase substrate-binding domain-containing protein [Acidimicrobiia bacterium]|nr:LON peptidase substrate-binding domain-containing protein [Acidimicrobiia bacterium]